jgi:hypothetical protein
VASLLTLTLACTKPDTTEDSVEEREDSPIVEEDTDPPADPEVTLRFFTTVELGGYGFKSEEGEGLGFGVPIRANSIVVYDDVPGHWWSIIISPDLSSCNQGETVLVNDGEIYDWTFSDLPGTFVWDDFACVMP